ncbi:MFS transporter [Pseudolysinimonas kribbensis]|uniref:MFS transporter n=1 Tax=Pseudolysinimonas kribbensis TaxID=433641 RepID=UPI0031D70518
MTTPTAATRRSPRSLRDAWIALAGLSAVFLFEMLDNSILNVALPTIGRDLHANTTSLQWVTGSYAVVFGGLMLLFGAIADRFGRRRVMLVGLLLLAVVSLGTLFVSSIGELIAIRVAMGVAAAMTTPGSMALAFRLFGDDGTRVRAINLISTVGLIGLAVGPTAGGLLLAVAPWQVLLLVNVPIALLAFAGILTGIAPDVATDLHRVPLDLAGAALGTGTVVLALVAPTLFVDEGAGSWMPWAVAAAAVVAGASFAVRQRTARHPLLDLRLIARPLVSSGLAFKAAAGLAIAALGFLVTLQLQLAWGWSPAAASLGMLPQVIVLIAGGAIVSPFVRRVGLGRAAWISAGAVVVGLAVWTVLGSLGYVWVALALALVAAGLRVVGVVAGTNVLRGLPANRTTIGAALVDTASEVTTGVGIAVAGTVLAALVGGDITSSWTAAQSAGFQEGALIAGAVVTAIAAVLVTVGFLRARAGDAAVAAPDAAPATGPVPDAAADPA